MGTFEYFASRGNWQAVRQLADYVINRHYPHLKDNENRYLKFLDAVIDAQASLIAAWMNVGFIHGVMNTDNMTISGETIDYGPCAFLDTYSPTTVYSFIDQHGRYAFAQQPVIAQWNLACMAQALMPFISDDSNQALELAQSLIHSFPERYEKYWLSGVRKKLGLLVERAEDLTLARDFLDLLDQTQGDYTNSFRELATLLGPEQEEVPLEFLRHSAFTDWLKRWRQRLACERTPEQTQVGHSLELMNQSNPVYIPRNHRIEQAIRAAVDRQDFAPMEELLTVLREPFVSQERFHHYAQPPELHERVEATFCGT